MILRGETLAWTKMELSPLIIMEDPKEPNNHVLLVSSPVGPDEETFPKEKKYWDLTDYTIEVKVMLSKCSQALFLICRAKDKDTYYKMEINPEGHKVSLIAPGGNELKNTGQVEVVKKLEEKVWYNLKLSCIGSRITGYVDGRKYIDVEGIPEKDNKGSFGLGVRSCIVYFDDVMVYGHGGAVEASGKLSTTWGKIKDRD